LTDFGISPQHQISHKSVQWEPRCTWGQTDRQTGRQTNSMIPFQSQ